MYIVNHMYYSNITHMWREVKGLRAVSIATIALLMLALIETWQPRVKLCRHCAHKVTLCHG